MHRLLQRVKLNRYAMVVSELEVELPVAPGRALFGRVIFDVSPTDDWRLRRCAGT
jgi:hypothetical protein